jgi:chromosome segregation ATPase
VIHEEIQVGEEEGFDERGPFVSLAEELIAEHSRLAELAERCRRDGEALAARERAVTEREHGLEDRRRELAQEEEALSRQRDELRERLEVVEQGEARIAATKERELHLARLGNELLAQYGSALPSEPPADQ